MTDALAVALVSIAALVAQGVLHRLERRDLLNRLMARDYGAYRDGQRPEVPGAVSNVFRHELERRGVPGFVAKGVDHGERERDR